MTERSVDREELLQKLELVRAGLSTRDMLEQSSCFVFTGKEIITYNDEVACRAEYATPFKGAVQSGPLIGILGKMNEERLRVKASTEELILRGNKRELGVRMEAEIMLGYSEVESPGTWRELPEEFGDAVDLVHECCSNDGSLYVLTCVNITPEGLQATDNYQLAKYDLALPTKKPFLVKKEAIKHITTLNMTHISQSRNWVHFKNKQGLTLSARRSASDGSFPDVSVTIKKVQGEKASLPKGLLEAVNCAQEFSAESTEEDILLVEVAKGKIRITGEGNAGWYKEWKSIQYNGPSLKFTITPKLLGKLAKQNRDCYISPNRLKIESDRFTFVTCLGKAK